ncbi:MAG: rRNA pseudouridine synthase [Dysgonamonadaceae bacterium]|jgi:23S rRNA pseudouridine2605 synthase|nr:rRNA pseudouridine synthase [Dysgonamonadaceae bacterium]
MNDEELRPRRNYDNAHDERHASSNRDYSNERRLPREGGSNYYGNSPERKYNNYRPYSNDNRSTGGGHNTGGDDDTRKRRPRVGERERVAYSNQGGQRDYRDQRDRNYGGGNYGGGNSDQGNGYPSRSYNNNRGGGYGNNNNRGGGYGNSNNRGGYNNNRSGGYNSNYNPRGPRPAGGDKAPAKKKIFKQIKYKENADPTAPIRLNKYLANAGVASRREADEFIQAGVVKVNGIVVTELGTKITRADEVTFHDQPVRLESKVYVLLNKPKGFVTTTDDPENRKTVMELVKSACSERIYPVGRLDRATSGVLLLTNDGDLASKLTHPKYEKRKIYQVWLDKPVETKDMQSIADGIELDDGEIHADAISYVTEEDLSQVGIEIHSGRNRVVRRVFEKLGYRVVKLDRVYFAGLTKKNLARGKWRYLSEKEVNMLRMGAFD